MREVQGTHPRTHPLPSFPSLSCLSCTHLPIHAPVHLWTYPPPTHPHTHPSPPPASLRKGSVAACVLLHSLPRPGQPRAVVPRGLGEQRAASVKAGLCGRTESRRCRMFHVACESIKKLRLEFYEKKKRSSS